MSRLFFSIILFGMLIASNVFADSFVVNRIEVQGLQRVPIATVLDYLPVKKGQTFDTDKSGKAVKALFDTGFFKDVTLSQQGNTLVVHVVERPVITRIKVTGNKDIETDQLNAVLRNLGLVEGQTYNPAVLEKVIIGLRTEYYSRGRYNVDVTDEVTEEPRNRVAIQIKISEGLIAKVEKVQIIGNHAFSERKLLSELPLATTNILSFFTRDNQYSREKLGKAVDTLTDFYMDRGYARFKVDNVQAELSPDRKGIYVTFRVTEGDVYKISGFKLVGNLILPEEQLRRRVVLKENQTFSRQKIQDSKKAIARAIGDLGYTFADINPTLDIDDKTDEVFVTFHVEPNHRVYVRQISFTGNAQTEDQVLRREMRQLEGSLAKTSQIDESVRRLKLLPFFQEANVETLPVANHSDQVDLRYAVKELPPATATAGVSYGTNGFGFNAAVNNNNFLGTGKAVGVAFSTDRFVRTYSFNYNNPYYTKDGVQRGFSVYSQKFTPGNINVSNYTYDTYGANVNYSVPISAADDSIQYGIGYQDTRLSMGNNPAQQIVDFVQAHGTHFRQALLTAGWTRNGLDRINFPTKGLYQNARTTIAVPVSGKALDYYKVNYIASGYLPIDVNRDWIFTASLNLGYGDGYGPTKNLPFFQNYFAGGVGGGATVRGYGTNSLGPKDSQGNVIGGNLMTSGSVGIVFPNFVSPDKLRTTWFVDAGNVYNTKLGQLPVSERRNEHAGSLRYSTGLGVDWRVPILGVLNFSFAKAINPQRGDDEEFFQFSFGTTF